MRRKTFTVLRNAACIVFLSGGTLMCDDIIRKKLDNGAVLLFRPMRELPVVSLQVWYNIGSVNEDPAVAGISHFIEHMLFKGTARRGVNAIAGDIERLGGHINAGTSKDFTYYHTEIPSSALETGLDVLSDIAANATFPAEEVERERLVILEEIKRSDDNPERKLYDLFMRTLIPHNAYGAPVIGSSATVSAMKREDLLAYYRKYYVPANMCIVVAGDFEPAKLETRVRELFGRFPEMPSAPEPGFPDGVPAAAQASESGNAVFPYLITGVRTVGVDSPDQYPLDLLSAALGQGVLSRLNMKLKEKEKIALSVSCGHAGQKRTGFFYVFANCETRHLKKLKKRIAEELALAVSGITEEELARVKALTKTQFILETETTDGQAYRLGISEVSGDHMLGERYLENIMKVTVGDIRDVSGRYLKEENFVTALFLPRK